MRHSGSTGRNQNLVDWTGRFKNRTNLEFFAGALEALRRAGVGNGGVGVIGLLGQVDLPGVALRTAQSVLRWDLRPSLWSHAFLIAAPAEPRERSVGRTPIWEATLHPREGSFPPPERNGVTEGTLLKYRNPEVDANAALLAVKMTDTEARQIVLRARRPNVDRLRRNFWEMLGVWQAYVWAQGKRPNPLGEGVPVFASSYVEMAYEAIHLDLSPGASERNSAPEHIWNGAAWWHQAFAQLGHPVSGYYVLRNKQCYLQDSGGGVLPDHLKSFGLAGKKGA
jgi:hypothetical protein